MGERRRAVMADLRQQAPEVTEREAQELGRVRHGEVPLDDLDQDMSSLLLSLAQDDFPPVHTPRVTESLARRVKPASREGGESLGNWAIEPAG